MNQEQLKDWALSLSTEKKIELLKKLYKDNFMDWVMISNIYLEAPIHKGGLPTEVITETTE